MGILTDDMQHVVERQRLGFVATICPDGTPNVSPKGTVAVWDDDHLVFADLRSPRTVRNLATNPAIEINVVDPIARKGCRFKGTGAVIREGEGPLYDAAVAFFRRRGTQSPIRSVVLVAVTRALPVVSPASDLYRFALGCWILHSSRRAGITRGTSARVLRRRQPPIAKWYDAPCCDFARQFEPFAPTRTPIPRQHQ